MACLAGTAQAGLSFRFSATNLKFKIGTISAILADFRHVRPDPGAAKLWLTNIDGPPVPQGTACVFIIERYSASESSCGGVSPKVATNTAIISEWERKMRQISIIVATALVTAAVTILSMNAISSTTSKLVGNAMPASPSVDVMQMMKDANELPHQNYDAYYAETIFPAPAGRFYFRLLTGAAAGAHIANCASARPAPNLASNGQLSIT